MSAVCVITPIVIGSWPLIASAVSSVAASLGFSVVAPALEAAEQQRAAEKVDLEVPNSEVVGEALAAEEKMVIAKAGVTLTFTRDERGACRVCVTGAKLSKRELRQIGEEVAGRVVQQFAYHKLMTELKARRYHVVEEQVLQDQSIRVRVRLGR